MIATAALPGLPDVPGLVVTGGGGWFGRAFLDRIASAAPALPTRVLVGHVHEVASVLATHPTAQVFVGDVTDEELLARVFRETEGFAVVHAAGVIHPRRLADFERVNAVGTQRVLSAASAASTGRVVHLSSNSPFGVNPRPDDRFRHDEPFSPWMGYGRSKMAAELIVRARVDDGQDLVIVRPPWFYGPWQPERQAEFFRMVRTGRFPLLGDGRQQRSMVYVENLVDGVLLALTTPQARGGAFWIADERPYPMSEVVDTVREALIATGHSPVRARTVRLPAAVGVFAGQVDGMLQRRGLYVQPVHVLGELDKTIACSISHSRDVLGYRPRVSLAEGMRRSLEWCRHNGITI